ncbi:MAG: hypothetical protein PVH29_12050 [Candidatus Zixiibacteriota bacterium]|jgi:hypothetical protein
MDFYEMDKMWHDIREEIAKETDGLTPEEQVARAKKQAEEFGKKYGLKTVKTTRRGSDQ